jgi:spore coat polysaccharide biosynthesis protein SpsF (cytidylyltransferase family)/MoaA/NifB/PqqE/SkfB family radical SAM enzyme
MIPAIIQISNINESLNSRNKQLINGEQQIVFLIKRLQNEFGENIIIATTNRTEDDDIEAIAKILHVKIYRGKFNDVLSRLLGAASFLHAENFIRIYGNYPLVDFEQAKELVQEHIEGTYDYSYNEHRNGVLRGTGCDVFRTEILEKLDKSLRDTYQREMVSFYLRQNKDHYNIYKKEVIKKRPGYRVSYETEKDLKVIRELINNIREITNQEIISYLNTHEIVSTYNVEMPPKEVGIEKLFLHGSKVEDILQNGINAMSYPISVELTLTNRCNLQCVYCSDLELRERQGNEAFLDYDILSRLFEDLAEGGTKGVVFEGGGEPTLHPDFSKLVRKAKENNLAVGLITNGTVRLDEADIRKLEWIRVSLDASNAEEYMSLKGVDCFERVLSNIAHYVQYCDTVGVGYVVTNNNLSDIETLILRLREMKVSYVQLRPVVDAPDLLPDERDLKYLECYRSAVFNVIVDGMKENMESGNDQLPCVANSLTGIISGDGSVFLCGRLNIYDWFNPIGNIRKQSFSEIWSGEERKRQLRMVGNASFCSKNCPQCRISKFNMLFQRLSQTKSVHFI